ncbi:MAG TPA: Ig-like domain-containing protein, partial [Longimicrobiaceae bacterium]|nr:Ig-like domain-containing protein [Longimicrobiaceae bacterium]
MKRLSSPLRRVLGGGLLALAVVGCENATGNNDKPVASVEITGVPTELYVGANVALGATLRDADGNELSNRPVSWISSDSTVARVTTGGVVTGRRSGQAVIVATSEQKSTTAVITVAIEPVASVEITGIPTAPVAAGTTLQLNAIARNASGQVLTGRAFFWVTSNYNLATVSGSGQVQALNGGNVLISVSTEGKSASFTLQIFDPVASVSVTPNTAGIYAAQTLQLTATPRSAAGAALTGRAVTWTTSDAGKATVDASGVVTAVGQGQVTITASSEGVGGMATLTILTRPTADWSQAAEWATFQGNARHTGFVPVTADPVAFREKWVRTPLGNAVLNPVTEGGGRVFVSSNAYFGGQSLAAVNTSSGANAWTYNFGAIHGVHPPAYGNGRVYVTTSGHQDSFLWGFDAATGTVAFRSAYGNQWSRYFAPVVTADAVYMAGGSYG